MLSTGYVLCHRLVIAEVSDDFFLTYERISKLVFIVIKQSAFHGSADAAKVLLDKDVYDGITLGLHKVADKEGKTAIDHAKEEGNKDVAKVIEEAVGLVLDDGTSEGMRKRK
jgi:hypothetical protein